MMEDCTSNGEETEPPHDRDVRDSDVVKENDITQGSLMRREVTLQNRHFR